MKKNRWLIIWENLIKNIVAVLFYFICRNGSNKFPETLIFDFFTFWPTFLLFYFIFYFLFVFTMNYFSPFFFEYFDRRDIKVILTFPLNTKFYIIDSPFLFRPSPKLTKKLRWQIYLTSLFEICCIFQAFPPIKITSFIPLFPFFPFPGKLSDNIK